MSKMLEPPSSMNNYSRDFSRAIEPQPQLKVQALWIIIVVLASGFLHR
jgi:hypothetical protein